MKDFLESIVKNLVEQPDKVSITEAQDDKERLVYTIAVADEDMGRIIGKEGKVINSIRMIMRVIAIRQNVRVRVDVEDKNRPEPTAKPEAPQEAPVEKAEVVAEPETEVVSSDMSVSDLVGQPVADKDEAGTTVLDNSSKS